MKQYLNILLPGIKYLILRVTKKCNAACPFCLNSYYQNLAEDDGSELTVDEYSRIARNISGLTVLNLSGGEPYLRPDLFEIADAFVVHSGARTISSPTNGSCPDRVLDFARKMLERHRDIVLKVGISIDAVGELHNEIRGLPSGYGNALETARALRELKKSHGNLLVYAITTVSGANATILDSVVDELSRLALFDDHFLTLVRGPTPETQLTTAEFELFLRVSRRLMTLYPPPASLKGRVFKSITKAALQDTEKSFRDRQQSFRCQAARRMLNISEQGNVCICEILPDPVLGNLREHEYDIGRILALPVTTERLRELERSACDCHWDCAIFGSLLFGGAKGYGKILYNMFRH
jgi:MoaA/NifB/PqqE/SkfB family radical SAM enzyme